VGRLDDILTRNRGEKGPRERTIVSIALGFGLLLIIALVLFTDLGLPDSMRHGTAGSGSAAPENHRADGVRLAAPPTHRSTMDAGVSDPASRAP
jgi:hypothetical protein